MEKKVGSHDPLGHFECEFVSDIVCPYCGSRNLDSWEVESIEDGFYEGDLGVQECGNCDKWFTASRDVAVSYCSYLAPCLNDEADHEWKEIVGCPKEFFEGRYRCKICGKEEVRKDG